MKLILKYLSAVALAVSASSNLMAETGDKWKVFINPNVGQSDNGFGIGGSVSYTLNSNFAVEAGMHSGKEHLKYIGVNALSTQARDWFDGFTPYVGIGIARYNPYGKILFVNDEVPYPYFYSEMIRGYDDKPVNAVYASIGTEYTLNERVSLRADYKLLSKGALISKNADLSLKESVVTIGIGYKF